MVTPPQKQGKDSVSNRRNDISDEAITKKKQKLLDEISDLEKRKNDLHKLPLNRPVVKLTPDIINIGVGTSFTEAIANRKVEGSPVYHKYPRKVILRNSQSPGDIVMMTAALRELHFSHPNKFITDVRTSCHPLWENNPFVTKLDENDPEVEDYTVEYPLVHSSNTAPYHFIHGFSQNLEELLDIKIRPKFFRGDIYLNEAERSWVSQVEETGIKDDFWIMVAGGKNDFTSKWWSPDFYQQVVDHFQGKIVFVQTGEKGHFHPPLKGVVNLIGKTDLRQFIRLVYHSVGVLCPVTFAMHAAAAVPVKNGRPTNRACVVIAGGREPAQWEAYPHHRYLSLNGTMDCCAVGGCWKSRCQKIGDGDEKDTKALCVYPVQIREDLRIAKCMHDIKPTDVIRAIETYYVGGLLKYNVSEKTAELLKELQK